jgi:hypothetical protein
MAKARRKESKFITAEDFVRHLREFFREAKDEDTVSVAEIRSSLDRVLILGEPDDRQLKAAALNRVREYAKNHPGDSGLSSSNVWRDIMGAGLICRLEHIEDAVTSLVDEGLIILVPGLMTTLLPADTEEEEINA